MRWFRAAALVVGAFLLLVHAAGAQGVSPSAVIDNYEHAWGVHDVDAALAYFADNAVVTVHDPRSRSLTTHQQICDFLRTRDLQAAPLLTTPRQSDGRTMSWSEHLQDQTVNGTDLTVQAVVENGKIQSLVYRPGQLIRGPDTATSSTSNVAPDLAVTVLAALLLLALGALSLASAPQRVTSSSNLRGRLLRDLNLWQKENQRKGELFIQIWDGAQQ